MEDLEIKEGILRGKSQREDEALVPDGSSGAGIVRFGSETAVRVDPEDDVGLEVAVTPAHVLEMLSGNNRNIEIVEFRRLPRGCCCHGGERDIGDNVRRAGLVEMLVILGMKGILRISKGKGWKRVGPLMKILFNDN